MSHLDFTTSPLEGVPNGILVTLTGSIDAATALGFQNSLEDLQKEGTKHFVIDMEGIQFVNSTGMGLLVRGADETVQGGGTFVLIKIHPKVKIVFEMLGLDAFFKIFTNLKGALDYIYEQTGMAPAGGGGSSSGGGGANVPAPPAPAAPRPVAPAPPSPAAPRPPAGMPSGGPPQGGTALPQTPMAPGLSSSVQQQQQQGTPPAPPGKKVTRIMQAPGQPQAPSAFIALSGRMPHYGIIYSFIQAACVGAGVIAARMDPTLTQQAYQRNIGALTNVNIIIADFTPVQQPNNPQQQIDPMVFQTAQYGRRNAGKPVVVLIQGRKEIVPPQWQDTPIVPYHASQQGVQYLKNYLENGLKQLVARIQSQR